MKRSPLQRRTPLRARTPLRQVGRRRKGQQVQYRRVRRDVEARSGGRCEIGTDVCELRGSECHHLLPRSQGGDDSIGNCVWACAPCHRWVHAHPKIAYHRGWLRHRSAS